MNPARLQLFVKLKEHVREAIITIQDLSLHKNYDEFPSHWQPVICGRDFAISFSFFSFFFFLVLLLRPSINCASVFAFLFLPEEIGLLKAALHVAFRHVITQQNLVAGLRSLHWWSRRLPRLFELATREGTLMLARNRLAMQIADFESCERDLRSQPVVTLAATCPAERVHVTDVTRGHK